MTIDLAQAVRDQFPGTPDEEIPDLIKMLRMMRPDDQLRIERNYYRGLAVERAEEALIWRRRFEGPQAPSVQDVLTDLQTRVSAATSMWAQLQEPAKPPTLVPTAKPARPWATVGPGCAAPAAPPLAQGLISIRKQLGFSQAIMAYRLHIPVAKLAQYEKGALVPPEVMALAKEQLL